VGELVRIVAVGRRLSVSRDGAGRGAWICRDSPACLFRAERARAFGRALRRDLDADALDDVTLAFERANGAVKSVRG